MNRLTVLPVEFITGGTTNTIYPAIVCDETEMVLFDCGYPGFFPLLTSAAAAAGFYCSKLTKIFITHHDYDHMGALAEFKQAYPQVQIIASCIEEPYISGRRKSLRLQQAEDLYPTLPKEQRDFARNFQQKLQEMKHVAVDCCVSDKARLDCCGGIEVVATPGHMPGHISLYLHDYKTLITGDALTMENSDLAMANPQYTLDMATAKESIKKLLTYDIEQIICYHGGSYTGNCREALQRLVR